ncbi:hypothetical protein [Caballeronia terrestris]|uniref:hypothetical protein n=1 Tax=Caballeronia terrestris TaxID=1226301 RepID=UPI001F223DF3|nr:hypothetical protein [Caballeronia terrestris]
MTLTPEGRDLLERAQRVLREADDIEQAMVAARAEPAGTLKGENGTNIVRDGPTTRSQLHWKFSRQAEIRERRLH